MPRSLATSGSELPAASLPSACRSLRMICSGECLLPNFESPPSAYGGLGDSHRNWIKSWGSGHDFVAKNGVSKEDLYFSLAALKEITMRFSAEDAIRYSTNASLTPTTQQPQNCSTAGH